MSKLLLSIVVGLMVFGVACRSDGGSEGKSGPKGDTGAQGPAGPAGNAVLHGDGAPSATDARAGDFYVDVTTHVFYGPFDGTGWGSGFALSTDGGLAIETDPVFQSSVAAALTTARLGSWDEAVAWGNHADAGYLRAETDPLFAASVASALTSTQTTSWNAAYAWGDHATQGYLKTELDPKIGTLTNGAIPTWSGASLTDSILKQTAGNLVIGIGAPAGLLTIPGVATFARTPGSAPSKSCGFPANIDWQNAPPSSAACNSYCTGQGFLSGGVTGTGTKVCGGSVCNYVSDFNTCAVASQVNDGNCSNCSTAFVCTCSNARPVSQFDSEVQVNQYLRLNTASGAPPAVDCDSVAERGRLRVDPASNTLYVCMNSGWVAK